MCLAAAYNKQEDANSLLCKNVMRIHVDGKHIRMETIVGDEIEVEGSIRFIDLMKNKVIIDCED